MGMDCEKFREMLDNYSDLSPQELDTLEAHALVCGECKRELEFMRSIINTVQSLPEIDPPADFLDKINERIDKEERLSVRICRKAVPYVRRYGALAACLAIGIAIGTNGQTLVSKMHNDSDGIIESTQTQYTESPSGSGSVAETPLGEKAVQEETVAAQNDFIAPSAPVQNSTGQSMQASSSNASSSAASSSHKTADQVLRENQQTQSSGHSSNNNSSSSSGQSRTASPSNASSGSAAASPASTSGQGSQPSAAYQPSSQPMTAQSNDNTAAVESAPQEQPVEAEASSSEQEPNSAGSVDVYSYIAPSDPEYYDIPASEYGRASQQSDENQAAGYDMMYEGASFAYSSPLVSSIVINQSDEARVKELVDVFITGTYGDFYMITSDDMALLLKQMDNEGIYYKDMMNDSGSRITFRIIVT